MELSLLKIARFINSPCYVIPMVIPIADNALRVLLFESERMASRPKRLNGKSTILFLNLGIWQATLLLFIVHLCRGSVNQHTLHLPGDSADNKVDTPCVIAIMTS
jgi:hypothetical protein